MNQGAGSHENEQAGVPLEVGLFFPLREGWGDVVLGFSNSRMRISQPACQAISKPGA